QLLTRGGTLTLGGGTGSPLQDALVASGATINISGGSINFTGARANTTQLASSDGRVFDIGAADPFITYNGFPGCPVAHPRCGIRETYINPLLSNSRYKSSFTDGVSAGAVSIAAINPIFEGDIVAATYTSAVQAALAQTASGANGAQATPNQLPNGGALNIKF